nr:DNA-deoxyinosine glycosylase [Oscillospiraceae bacterium]
VFGAPEPKSIEEKRALALSNGLALWDSLVECDIRGASDTSIKNPVASDIPWLLERTRITRVYTTGAAADRYYRLYNLPRTGIESVRLPSTSPANCAVSFESLVGSYRVLRGE